MRSAIVTLPSLLMSVCFSETPVIVSGSELSPYNNFASAKIKWSQSGPSPASVTLITKLLVLLGISKDK